MTTFSDGQKFSKEKISQAKREWGYLSFCCDIDLWLRLNLAIDILSEKPYMMHDFLGEDDIIELIHMLFPLSEESKLALIEISPMSVHSWFIGEMIYKVRSFSEEIISISIFWCEWWSMMCTVDREDLLEVRFSVVIEDIAIVVGFEKIIQNAGNYHFFILRNVRMNRF